MKKIIVCDSGLGGLNIAARFFRRPATETNAEILYFNAYPFADKGFNKIKSPRDQEALLKIVLEAMTRFTPDLCLIACNTLSIVYERLEKYFVPPFPVVGILDAATDGLAAALRADPESHLLILGTRTTVESEVYAQRLAAQGIDRNRIHALAVPGLATLLEAGPDAPEVAARIAKCADEAKTIVPENCGKLFLGLCCTHFGFAAPVWKKEFSARFGSVALLDPDEWLGGECAGKSFQYVSRIPFFGEGQKAMMAFFASRAPEIASALATAHPDPDLFQVPEEFFN